ncbi:MAG TPA: CGNR zinc finger domain-containing protein [Vicinamibacteria bacterium]|nr:CGNR zinc finger domain-containing protein [Vicinamibacteria bacterium]
MAESLAGTMSLVGGDPTLDFVNTVGGRRPQPGGEGSVVIRDKLVSYADLLAWSRHAGLLPERSLRRLDRLALVQPAEATAVLAQAVELREALHRALKVLMTGRDPRPADLRLLDRELRRARESERLVRGPGRLTWSTHVADARLESVLDPVRRAASALLTSAELPRLRQCSGQDCGWLFLDRSRNRSRHWCTMQDCGNRTKVRRFRARHVPAQRRKGSPGCLSGFVPARRGPGPTR